MTYLTEFRDHCRERASWQPGDLRAACRDRTAFGSPKPPDHVNCGGHKCGCDCHAPTGADRELFTRLADEIDAYLVPADEPDLFGVERSRCREDHPDPTDQPDAEEASQ
jgi:hypothetical protein